MKKALVAVLVFAVLVVGVVAFRYDVRQGAIRGQAVTIRVDRFTRNVEYLSPNGWKPLTPETYLTQGPATAPTGECPAGMDPDVARALNCRLH